MSAYVNIPLSATIQNLPTWATSHWINNQRIVGTALVIAGFVTSFFSPIGEFGMMVGCMINGAALLQEVLGNNPEGQDHRPFRIFTGCMMLIPTALSQGIGCISWLALDINKAFSRN